MPYMTIGTVVSAIGAGLLTTLNLTTSTACSTAFMFLVGAGAGIGGNQPFTALQAALRYVFSLRISLGLTISNQRRRSFDWKWFDGVWVTTRDVGIPESIWDKNSNTDHS